MCCQCLNMVIIMGCAISSVCSGNIFILGLGTMKIEKKKRRRRQHTFFSRSLTSPFDVCASSFATKPKKKLFFCLTNKSFRNEKIWYFTHYLPQNCRNLALGMSLLSKACRTIKEERRGGKNTFLQLEIISIARCPSSRL